MVLGKTLTTKRVPWTLKRSNQSILKEINSEYSLEELKPKLKLQYFDHLIQKSTFGKDPDAGRDESRGRWGVTEDEKVEWHH